MATLIDMTGERVGSLVITGRVANHHKGSAAAMWGCRCDCGNTVKVTGSDLRAGKQVSCGCRKSGAENRMRCAELGRSGLGVAKAIERASVRGSRRDGTKTPEYRAWVGLKNRCLNPKNKDWSRYGGRGITVCSEWSASFEAFLSHVGKRPSAQHTIDRINNNGHYEPGNVRWVPMIDNLHNRRSRHEWKKREAYA